MLLKTFLILILLPGLLTAQEVIVHEAEVRAWSDSAEALGTLRANETVVLTATVTDTITKIHFKDGQYVEKGFVLAEMTSEEEAALVSENIARVAEAKSQFDRLRQLPKTGAVSESLYDQREREYKSAVAQLDAMKSRLEDRLIVAPFSGYVGLRTISVGALVEPGDEIVTLNDNSVMKLDFAVPAIFLGLLQTGLDIEAKTEAYPDKSFSGQVSGIDSQVDPVTRSVTVRAIIDNPENLLKPGLLMSVALTYNQRSSVVILEESLIPSAGTNFVFVVEDGKAAKKEVDIGSRREGLVEVRKGLEGGEQVITHGTMKTTPGAEVTVKSVQKPGDDIAKIIADK